MLSQQEIQQNEADTDSDFSYDSGRSDQETAGLVKISCLKFSNFLWVKIRNEETLSLEMTKKRVLE
jgi:hypothetical protein